MVFVPNPPAVPWDPNPSADASAPALPQGSEVNSNLEILPLHLVSGRARPRDTRSMMSTGAKFCGELDGI
jgi:hypothetical protein